MPKTPDPRFAALRQAMVKIIGVHAKLCADRTRKERLGARVLAAMERVPRHEFVPVELQQFAYEDSPLPIGSGKTISQPFMVALMSDLLEVSGEDRILEVGTGLGYQSAILAELADQVFTVEILEELASEGKRRLRAAGYDNVRFQLGDGARGWAEHAPYDKIIVTAAAELIPPPLLEQLRPGGRMVIPAGLADAQQLLIVDKNTDGRVKVRETIPVLFSTLIASH